MEQKTIRIPDMDVILEPAEIAVTQTKTFQRLFFLRQLGLAYIVYPGATHTRATHSIQCVYEANKILEALDKSGNRITNDDRKAVRMAALLHDIGHIPFSHTLEDEHLVFKKKHDNKERLDVVFKELEKEVEHSYFKEVEKSKEILLDISTKLPEKSVKDWKSDLVGNTVCADLLAYIVADACWTGIEKRPGYYRIYNYFTIIENQLCIRLTKGGLRTDIVSAIMDLLDMRYALTERVIFHHAKCIASAMLARATYLSEIKEGSELLKLGDEGFISLLDESANKKGDNDLIELIGNIKSRRLYKRIYKICRRRRDAWDESRTSDKFCEKWRNIEEVEKLLSNVEKSYKLPKGSLVLWCPEPKAGMKLAKVKVVWNSSTGESKIVELRSDDVKKQFPGVYQRVETIEEQYLDLWTFWIAINRKYMDRSAEIQKKLQELLQVECDQVFIETYLKTDPEYNDIAFKKKNLV